MSKNTSTAEKTRKLVGMALFAAIVVILQFVGSFIKFGMFSVSLVLIPIVVGAAMYGVGCGLWLGLVFSVTVLATGDAAAFLVVNPLGTVVTVLAKGCLAGVCAGLTYKALNHTNKYLAVIASAVVCPLVNTGIFLIGCVLFFIPLMQEWAAAFGFGDNVVQYMFVGLAGGNFLFEMLFNIILSPAIIRLLNIKKV